MDLKRKTVGQHKVHDWKGSLSTASPPSILGRYEQTGVGVGGLCPFCEGVEGMGKLWAAVTVPLQAGLQG